jgi:GH24 family phage-related lysozyme (muramidase)
MAFEAARRSNIASGEYRMLAKPVFAQANIAIGAKLNFDQSLALSSMMYNAGTWLCLGVMARNALNETLLRAYRTIAGARSGDTMHYC